MDTSTGNKKKPNRRILHNKDIIRAMKNLKNQAKIVPLWFNLFQLFIYYHVTDTIGATRCSFDYVYVDIILMNVKHMNDQIN